MALPDTNKYDLAKSLTELAIQHGLLTKCENAEDSAKEVVTFYNTIFNEIDPKGK